MTTPSTHNQPPVRRTADDWTIDRVARFWNWYAAQPHLANEYFSRHWALSITSLVKLVGGPRGHVLDYGCGPGFLLDALVSEGVTCSGLDFSRESVSIVSARLGQYDCFKGAVAATGLPTPFDEASFDTIVCVEVVEHLSAELLDGTIQELFRLVKPGGIVILTTPNDEDLSRNTAYCPFCNSEFHRMQHMRAFSTRSLVALLTNNGFCVEFCGALNMADFATPKLRKLSAIHPSLLYRLLKLHALSAADRILRTPLSRKLQLISSKGGHLTALARRPMDCPCAE